MSSYRSRPLAAGLLVLTLILAVLPMSAASANTYTVRSGDSLWKIAQQHGTTIAALQSTNSLVSAVIHPGQRLTVPSTGGTYTVRRGDSLWTIATRHGTTVAALQAANGIGSTLILPGQRLSIPGGEMAVTASRSGGVGLSAADLDLLARLVRAEAEAEPYAGQVAVAAVVLNRIQSSRFPNTVRGVIYTPGQFCVVENGRINLTAGQTHRQAVQEAAGGWDPSNGALYFFNPAGTTNKFMLGLSRIAVIGRHVFAR